MPIDVIERSFLNLFDPGNMFLIPKAWSGLGELPEFIEVAKTLSPSTSAPPR